MAVVPDVDANGDPETPANQMTEKKKQQRMTVIGVVLGGLGLAVAVFVHKRNAAAAASGGTSQPTVPSSSSIDPTTGVPYSSEQAAYMNAQGPSGAAQGTFSAGETALMSQLSQTQSQLAGFQAGQTTYDTNMANYAAATNAGQVKYDTSLANYLAATRPMNTQTPFNGTASGATHA